MKVLAIEREVPGVSAGQFTAELGRAEAGRVWELQQAGIVREIYFRTDETSAVLMLECESVEAAKEELARLPLAAAGLIEFEVLGLRAYPGFERLFAPGAAARVRPGEAR